MGHGIPYPWESSIQWDPINPVGSPQPLCVPVHTAGCPMAFIMGWPAVNYEMAREVSFIPWAWGNYSRGASYGTPMGPPMGCHMGLTSYGASYRIYCGTSLGCQMGYCMRYRMGHAVGHPMNTLLDVLYGGHLVG